jgi:hypothetical protein
MIRWFVVEGCRERGAGLGDDGPRWAFKAGRGFRGGLFVFDPDQGPLEARQAELDHTDDVRGLVDMVGGVVTVDMARKALVGLALLMGVAVFCDRGRELGVPDCLGLGDGIGVVAGRDVGRRQSHAQRHREGDDETGQGSDAAARHDEQGVADFLTKV